MIKQWTSDTASVLFTMKTSRHSYAMTWEHIRMAGFMGIFSAFYYAVVSATDATLREGVMDTAEDGIREACAARLALLSGATKDLVHRN